MLPDTCRWLDTAEASRCHYHYRCIAVVVPGEVTIVRGVGRRTHRADLVGKCGSIAQGKRFVERWIQAHGPMT